MLNPFGCSDAPTRVRIPPSPPRKPSADVLCCERLCPARSCVGGRPIRRRRLNVDLRPQETQSSAKADGGISGRNRGGVSSRPSAFKSVVRTGNITGPYDGLYYWKISSNDDIDHVGALLWAHLGGEKRRQFRAAAARMQRALPGGLDDARDHELEAAWAAGLFDGEGTFRTYRDPRLSAPWRGVSMSLPQASATDVPETLVRFRRAVGTGSVTGPRMVPSAWSRLPQYRWQATGRHVVSAAAKVIWPWLGPVKRAEMRAAMEHLDPDASDWMTELPA